MTVALNCPATNNPPRLYKYEAAAQVLMQVFTDLLINLQTQYKLLF